MATKKKEARRKASTARKTATKARRRAKARAVPAGKAAPEIGSDAVKKATGRGWEEWFELLDRDRAYEMAHRDIAILLNEKHGVGAWWRQMVTVGYERARGLREKHERPDGYEVSASRTMRVDIAAVFDAWNDARRRARWLGEEITVRGATPGKGLRVTWSDGTTLLVGLWPKGEGKTQVVAQHGKLKSAAAGEKMKKYWAGKLRELEEFLGGG